MRSFPFPAKVAAIAGIIGVIAFLLSLPATGYRFGADTPSPVGGANGFSGVETFSSNEHFNWSQDEATLLYPNVPRYAPLNLKIRANLRRPADAPPARIEIFEGTNSPNKNLVPLGVITFDPNNPATQDYYFTVPVRSSGEGLLLQFKTNSFQVKGDNRQLGFIFFNSEVSLPAKHILYLFWPNPFIPGCFLLLVILAAWTLRAGFSWLESLLFSGLAGWVMLTMAASTFQRSWWLVLVAALMGAVYWWEGRNMRAANRWGSWPLLSGTAVLLVFFLFTGLMFQGDIDFYFRWSASVHDNGLWNIYNYDVRLNYLPLLPYLLWFYNLAAYPLGFHESYLAWKIVASLAYLGVIYLLLRLVRAAKTETTQPTDRRLVLLAFNAAFFYNSTVWGQSDMLAVLGLIFAMLLVYQGKGIAGGATIGLLIISKPQAWFVLPILACWLLQRCGWKKTLAGLSLGGAIALLLSAIAFGFDINGVFRYFGQAEFTGTYDNSNPNASNFTYLIITNQKIVIPAWISLVGGIVVCATLGLLLWFRRKSPRTLHQFGLEMGLFGLTCFSWLIKIKERYLIFSLPFLGISAIFDKRLVKPLLALSWLQLLQLTISMFQQGRSSPKTMADNFYLWSAILNRSEVQWLMSAGTLALWGYLLFYYLRRSNLLRPAAAPDTQANSKELVSS